MGTVGSSRSLLAAGAEAEVSGRETTRVSPGLAWSRLTQREPDRHVSGFYLSEQGPATKSGRHGRAPARPASSVVLFIFPVTPATLTGNNEGF